jgi:Ca-activated chloride channel family protein
MTLLPEDPRLTAYALGEIEDDAERNTIKAAVAESPELQAAVAEIQAMGDLLGSSLGAEALPELTEFEKARMEAPQTRPSVRRRFLGELLIHWPLVLGSSAAAVAAVALTLFFFSERYTKETQYGLNLERPVSQERALRDPRLNVDASMKAVEDLDIRVDQQLDKVDELLSRMDELNTSVEVGSSRSSDVSNPELLRVSEFKKERAKESSDSVVTRSESDAFMMPQAAPEMKPTRTLRSSVTLASVDVPLPVIEDSFTVSSGLSSVEGVESMQLLGKPREMDVSVFGLKTRPEEKLQISNVGSPITPNTEQYARIEETDFRSPLVAPLSTFSIDVDTASYANVRRFLDQGQLPPADAVRIEELINYFPYADAAPTKSLDAGGAPFAVHMAQTTAPWNTSNHLLRVALKGYEMPWDERPASNLVFLLDVSGSMNAQNKLPLVKEAMDLLVHRLDARDRVAVVVYAGASGLALPSTTANNRETIQHAMANLKAGGSTNGGAGIQLAYEVARKHFIEGGNNRVILCTDGDFNVGQTNSGELTESVEAAADDGISLTILGFGMGNYNDDMLETLSNKGKGSYAYVDSSAEARKVFLEDLTGNLFKIAKDVKIQVEFNPEQVSAYRLIGYENRRLQAEDFNNDQKKAGDIGPGHTVVALYEIIPSNVTVDLPGVDALRYQQKADLVPVSDEVATVKLRYKQPDADVSQLITCTVGTDELVGFDAASDDVRFSTIVAAFGMRLAESPSVSELSYNTMESIAANALGVDPGGHRSEFIGLIRKARELSGKGMPVQHSGAGEE